jgi:hypothetical protein
MEPNDKSQLKPEVIAAEELMNIRLLEKNIELIKQKLEQANLEYQFFMLMLYRKYSMDDSAQINKNGMIIRKYKMAVEKPTDPAPPPVPDPEVVVVPAEEDEVKQS